MARARAHSATSASNFVGCERALNPFAEIVRYANQAIAQIPAKASSNRTGTVVLRISLSDSAPRGLKKLEEKPGHGRAECAEVRLHSGELFQRLFDGFFGDIADNLLLHLCRL